MICDLGGHHLLSHVHPADQGELSARPVAGSLFDCSQTL